MKNFFSLFLILSGITAFSYVQSSLKWKIWGRFGLSVLSSDVGAGFQIGPMGELIFNKNIGIGTEFNVNK